jgi:hypothetical protein
VSLVSISSYLKHTLESPEKLLRDFTRLYRSISGGQHHTYIFWESVAISKLRNLGFLLFFQRFWASPKQLQNLRVALACRYADWALSLSVSGTTVAIPRSLKIPTTGVPFDLKRYLFL